MIAMAVARIVLRNLFGFGISWGDILVRIPVLWVGLLGAMGASRQNKDNRFLTLCNFVEL